MTRTAAAPRPAAGAVDPRPGARGRALACFVLACWVVLLAFLALVGERPATLADLERDLRAGEVTVLEVAGGLGDPAALGYAGVELRWQTRWTRHHASAVEATPGRETREARRAQRSSDDPAPVVGPGLRERLVALSPAAVPVEVREVGHRGSNGVFYGLRTPMWTTWPLLGLWLGTFAHVRLDPRAPERATRAAWSWLVLLTGPIGSVAYLVLGGPAGLLAPPRPGRRRLTGGWAFLLACAVASWATAST